MKSTGTTELHERFVAARRSLINSNPLADGPDSGIWFGSEDEAIHRLGMHELHAMQVAPCTGGARGAVEAMRDLAIELAQHAQAGGADPSPAAALRSACEKALGDALIDLEPLLDAAEPLALIEAHRQPQEPELPTVDDLLAARGHIGTEKQKAVLHALRHAGRPIDAPELEEVTTRLIGKEPWARTAVDSESSALRHTLRDLHNKGVIEKPKRGFYAYPKVAQRDHNDATA